MTTGGPDCTLHLILHVPVTALCTEQKQEDRTTSVHLLNDLVSSECFWVDDTC